MFCPTDKIKLEKAIISGVEADYCPKCLGLWFEEEELRFAKDYKDKDLRWLDIDLWEDEKKLKISPGRKICPSDRMPLYEVGYGDSNIHPVKSAKGGAEQFNGVKVDLCNICKGVWLDRGEFQKIIQYLKEKSDKEILDNYLKNLREELGEIFQGPEGLKEEIGDLIAILKLFVYKFTTQHPAIAKIIAGLPR